MTKTKFNFARRLNKQGIGSEATPRKYVVCYGYNLRDESEGKIIHQSGRFIHNCQSYLISKLLNLISSSLLF